ncbi:hypothetical protein [Microbacterium lacticum]|uniref:hypothetical protein n=1 Tax=Microbacterium lacticum TaxID=33885 RepID=UPI0028D736B8|nr:hypothetical protein [Microbacterium lacticum]
MTNIDDVAQTLAEYERLAITSGATVQIDPPEFSTDGDHWLPIVGELTPRWARATVHRDGIATTVYASWDESLPVETAQTEDGRLWRDIWEQKPMQRFGSFIVRAALRRAFREVIGDRVEPDEDAPRVSAPESAVDRTDWDAQIEDAADVAALEQIWRDMRPARARTGAREVAYLARRAQLAAAAWEPAPARDLSADELAHHHAFFGHEPKAPQDHQAPQNRAARRASARKKGGRR